MKAADRNQALLPMIHFPWAVWSCNHTPYIFKMPRHPVDLAPPVEQLASSGAQFNRAVRRLVCGAMPLAERRQQW